VKDRLRRKGRTQSFTGAEMAELESLFDPDDYRTKAVIEILNLFERLGVQSERVWDETP
jgi:hypothetical protein